MDDIIKVPDILIPKQGTDFSKWSVVACDQYTSEPEYWERTARSIGTAPSTLNIIFPEAYLGKTNEQDRIGNINLTMRAYLDTVLEMKKGFVFIERKISGGKTRKGLLICIDLEAYDYTPFTDAPIRATEGTVLDRLPPRIRIRENACLECPHILFLIDDKKKTVIEPLSSIKKAFKKIYSTILIEDGGYVEGYLIDDQAMQDDIVKRIYALERDGFIFAVGDGNHSLATAKEIWKKLKTGLNEQERKDHPARYAMVETVNLYDDGLVFEPIHRILFGAGKFLDRYETSEQKPQAVGSHVIEYIRDGKKGYMTFRDPKHNLPVGTLQEAIDTYISENKEARVDYIHGDEVVKRLSVGDNIGFLLEPMKKEELFETVKKDGVLPRKTFSMGEAHDKRYYLECRRITPSV
jgi:uncharacterized protein (DUF1015 family)